MSNNLGIKVSQIGSDYTDGDESLIYSSGWQTLKIEATDTFTGVQCNSNITQGIPQLITTHTLGYPAVFFIWQYNSSGTDGEGGDTPTRILYQPEFRGSPIFFINSSGLYAQSLNTFDFTLNIRWYITRLPINQNLQAPKYDLSSHPKAGTTNNFGIKASKPGKDITSTDLRDFTLHSATRGPLIHAVKTGPLIQKAPFDFELLYDIDLPYTPMYMGFINNPGLNFSDPTDNWINEGAFLDTNGKIQIFSAISGQSGSIVVFKDPFEPDSITNIST